MADPDPGLLDQFRRLLDLGRAMPLQAVSGRRYRVTGALESGRSSRILKGRSETGRRVAIKRFHPHLLAIPHVAERVRGEVARAAVTLHGRLVPALDYGEDEAGPFLVLERLEVVPLESVFERAPLLPAESLRLARELAHLLDELWSRRLVEGAFSPRRMFLRKDGTLLAKGCSGADYRWLTETVAPEPSASVRDHWPAPEQLMGAPGDTRSHLYSLGLILERLHLPMPLDLDHLEEMGLRPPVDGVLRPALDRLLEPDPDLRLDSTGDLLRLLDDLERHLA